MPLEVMKQPRRSRSASRIGGWNDHPMLPSNSDRMVLQEAKSSVKHGQLEKPESRAHRRSASLTRSVNVFEEYDQT